MACRGSLILCSICSLFPFLNGWRGFVDGREGGDRRGCSQVGSSMRFRFVVRVGIVPRTTNGPREIPRVRRSQEHAWLRNGIERASFSSFQRPDPFRVLGRVRGTRELGRIDTAFPVRTRMNTEVSVSLGSKRHGKRRERRRDFGPIHRSTCRKRELLASCVSRRVERDRNTRGREDVGTIGSETRRLRGNWIPFLIASAGAFGLLSLDMGTTQVLHRWLEIPIREYVHEHTIGEWRSFWAGQVLSDYPVEIMSVLFFTRVGLKMVGKSSHEEKYLGFLSIAFYFLVSGYIPHHDVPAIKAMKDAFMRERPVPSDSFAFPSGHTAAASYLAGMLTTGLDSANASDVSKGSTTGTRSPLSRDGGKKWRRAVHWVLPVLMVASGRVISERHWLGDTFAGAAFGAGSVFLLLALHQCLSILPWNKE